jgi:hypothetical protein
VDGGAVVLGVAGIAGTLGGALGGPALASRRARKQTLRDDRARAYAKLLAAAEQLSSEVMELAVSPETAGQGPDLFSERRLASLEATSELVAGAEVALLIEEFRTAIVGFMGDLADAQMRVRDEGELVVARLNLGREADAIRQLLARLRDAMRAEVR